MHTSMLYNKPSNIQESEQNIWYQYLYHLNGLLKKEGVFIDS